MMSHWAQFKDCTQKRQDFVATPQQAVALLGFSAKPRDFPPGSIGCSQRIAGLSGAFRRWRGRAQKRSSLFLETLY
jgi:hypothetical protein